MIATTLRTTVTAGRRGQAGGGSVRPTGVAAETEGGSKVSPALRV